MIFRILMYFWVFTALFILPLNTIQNQEKNEVLYTSVFDLSKNDTLWIEQTLASMTLREKCAQMVFPYAMGRDTSKFKKNFARLKKLVANEHVGGILFLQGDIHNQIVLTNRLQELSKVPLLISADYERGVGMRLEDGVEFPYNMAFGAVNDPNLTYMMGKVTALEGRYLGVHQNFAPLMDVNHGAKNPIINIRAYASDPDIISAHGTAFIRGMREGRMLTTAKHFPGHGASETDSHLELPLINRTKEELELNDLVPFQEAIKSGVHSVMTGHLQVPAYEDDETLPATLSKKITTDLLQHQIGFDGLIVTDAMNMSAILNNYSQAESGKMAVLAGNDIILFPYYESECIDGIYDAVKSGEIEEERIDYSVRKILTAKKWLGLDQNKIIDEEVVKQKLNHPGHWRLAAEVAEKSITLVKNDESLIPLIPNDYYATASIILSDSKNDVDYKVEELVNENFDYVKTYQLNVKSKKSNYKIALKFAKTANLIIVSTFVNVRDSQGSISINEDHLALIKDLLKLKKPVIILSFGNPYILEQFPEAKTYLCAYGEPVVSQRAMINAVLGKNSINGKLPISISTPNLEYERGFGLELNATELNFPPESSDTNYSFTSLDSIMEAGINNKAFPGAVLLIGQRSRVIYHKAFGNYSYDDNAKKMGTDAIFDLASLSKVLGTTSAAMILVDQNKIDLDEKVSFYLPEFANNDKENITIRNLLLHNAGFVPFKPFYKNYDNADEVINDIMNSKLSYEPGEQTKYSDLGMITLQKVIEKVSGQLLDIYLNENLFKPLGMEHTMYNPDPKYWYYCVPTEKDTYWRNMTLKGKVHDEAAYMLNGVAGHAGLFSTATDISKLAYTLLNNGYYGTTKIFEAETIDSWTKKQNKQSSRGLGWDTNNSEKSSSGTKFSKNSFGHTGYTGTSIWFDKDRDLFVILLTNRVHPTRENRKIIKFRPKLHDIIIDAVDYF